MASTKMNVLVVDDDAMVLATMVAILRDADFCVMAARSGPEALRLADGQRIDLLVSDVMMPAMNGRELAAQIECRHPGVRVLLVTGAAQGILDGDAHPVLDKPFTPEALLDAVRDLL